MSLDFSPPYNPGDRVRHIDEGWLGTVQNCELKGAHAQYWSCRVKFDPDCGVARRVTASLLEPAPKHVAFACIVNPLRKPLEFTRSTGPRHPDGGSAA